jgi:hypothetical protein
MYRAGGRSCLYLTIDDVMAKEEVRDKLRPEGRVNLARIGRGLEVIGLIR